MRVNSVVVGKLNCGITLHAGSDFLDWTRAGSCASMETFADVRVPCFVGAVRAFCFHYANDETDAKSLRMILHATEDLPILI